MLKKQNKMAVMPMGKLIVNVAFPIMVSLLVQSLFNIVDSMYVAKISEDSLTATSLVFPLQLFMISVAVGTSIGVNSLLSRTLGKGENDRVSTIAVTSMILCILSALFFTLLGTVFINPVTHFFVKDSSIYELSKVYIAICMQYSVFHFVQIMVERFLQAAGHSVLSMFSLFSSAGLNIILDPILIFGKFGLPAMGVKGAAVATVIAQGFGCFVVLILHFVYNKEVKLSLKNYKMSFKDVKDIYTVGLPAIVTQSLGSIMISSVNSILMPVSKTAVAFYGAYFKLQTFMFMPVNGLGQGSLSIIGFNYGAKNKERIYSCMKIIFAGAIVWTLSGTIIFKLLPRQILGIYNASEEMLAIGVPALRTISTVFVFTSITFCIGNMASGLGHGITNMVSSVLRQLLILIPCMKILVNIFGIDKIWYATWIADITAFVYAVLSLRRQIKNKVECL